MPSQVLSCRLYRAYLFNSQGHIHSLRELYCPDDEEAIRQARHLPVRCAVELWERSRKIASFPAH
jgi:hypothetical protein